VEGSAPRPLTLTAAVMIHRPICFLSGVQKWIDGSIFCGKFEDDLKHGVGLYRWPNGEVYYIILFSVD